MTESRRIDAPDIAKRELGQFLSVARQVGIAEDHLRHSLDLSSDDWQRWVDILQDAPLPPQPELPQLLRRLGYVTNRLDRRASSA